MLDPGDLLNPLGVARQFDPEKEGAPFEAVGGGRVDLFAVPGWGVWCFFAGVLCFEFLGPLFVNVTGTQQGDRGDAIEEGDWQVENRRARI